MAMRKPRWADALVLVFILWCCSYAQTQDSFVTGSITTTTCPGPGSGTGCLRLNVAGAGSGAVEVSGVWAGTLEFEALVNGTWTAAPAYPLMTAGQVSSTTANGTWLIGAAGFQAVRVRASTLSSGTATVAIRVAPGSTQVVSTLPIGGASASAQAAGNASLASIDSKTPATGALTDTQLRATPVPVSGTVATGGLTDVQLRATPVPVSGTVTATGPLTDTQLRASPVPVTTGGLTDTELRATPVPVSGTVVTGGLTDTQLRATPVDVLGPLTNTELRATPVPVSGTVSTGGLTDSELRATPVPVSATNLDIRDLTFAADKVDASGSTVIATATNLDIRDLVFASDKVDVSGSTVSSTVTGTVTANQGTAAAGTAGWPTIAGNATAQSATWTTAMATTTNIAMDVTNMTTVTFSVLSGTFFDGNFVYRGSIDGGTTYKTWYCNTIGPDLFQGDPYISGLDWSVGVPTNVTCDVHGLTHFQVRFITAATVGGPVNIRLTGTSGGGAVMSHVLARQQGGTDLGPGDRWYMSITDGLSTVAVKAASTPAGATDEALVVAISPNNTVAVTGPLTDTQLRATPVPVSATNLDIRDLVFASDKVDASGSAVTATVTATDLDIRNLVFATDKVDASGSTVTANAGTNLNTSLLALESGGNLATLAGIVTAARAAVNPISGQTGVAGGTGADAANVIRTSLATNVPLPAGTNVLGHVITDTGSVVQANAGTNLNTSLLAIESGGNLASIKTNTDPFVASGAGGYVRQDSTATIAKETGGNLATLVANQTNRTQKSQVTDGTRDGTVKAASTAAAAADTSFVVAFSPNSPATTKTALTFNAPAAATVGVASAQALATNASRKGAIFVNTSVNTISCAVGATAVLYSGVTLIAGASWTMNEYSFGTGAVNCIASGATSNLSVQELQ